MKKGQVVTIEDRIPKLKHERKQKANRRFVFYILLFFLMLLAIVYFQSPLSNVGKVNVEGNTYVDTETIIALTGVTDETSYWSVEVDDIRKNILKNHQIKKVDVVKSFPNSLTITVVEYHRVGYAAKDNAFYPVLESGKLLPAKDNEVISDAPLLVGWNSGEVLQEMAAELSKLPASIMNRISEIHFTPTEVDSLHVTLFMTDGYEVSATIRDFANKMKAYPAIASEIPEGVEGVIHLEVGSYFKAYEDQTENEGENGNEGDE